MTAPVRVAAGCAFLQMAPVAMAWSLAVSASFEKMGSRRLLLIIGALAVVAEVVRRGCRAAWLLRRRELAARYDERPFVVYRILHGQQLKLTIIFLFLLVMLSIQDSPRVVYAIAGAALALAVYVFGIFRHNRVEVARGGLSWSAGYLGVKTEAYDLPWHTSMVTIADDYSEVELRHGDLVVTLNAVEFGDHVKLFLVVEHFRQAAISGSGVAEGGSAAGEGRSRR